jgi:hypothetical protein
LSIWKVTFVSLERSPHDRFWSALSIAPRKSSTLSFGDPTGASLAECGEPEAAVVVPPACVELSSSSPAHAASVSARHREQQQARDHPRPALCSCA